MMYTVHYLLATRTISLVFIIGYKDEYGPMCYNDNMKSKKGFSVAETRAILDEVIDQSAHRLRRRLRAAWTRTY
jgi:hypothetical protein